MRDRMNGKKLVESSRAVFKVASESICMAARRVSSILVEMKTKAVPLPSSVVTFLV